MTFPVFTSLRAATVSDDLDEDFVLVNGAEITPPAVEDPDTRVDLARGRQIPVRGRLDRMRSEFKRKEMDATTYLNRLLNLLGDSGLDEENEAAALYLQALQDLKSRMPRLPVFGAKSWSESMVATALVSTRPAALRAATGSGSKARAAEIQRWISRVTRFVEQGLVRRNRCADLLLDTGSDMPLPRKALQQGDPTFNEFVTVMDGYTAAAKAGVIRHGDLVRLFQAPVRLQSGYGPSSNGETLLSAAVDAGPTALQSLKAAAQTARDCGALTNHEFKRVIEEKMVLMPAQISGSGSAESSLRDEVDELSRDDAALAWKLVQGASGFEPARPRRQPDLRDRTGHFAPPQRFSKA